MTNNVAIHAARPQDIGKLVPMVQQYWRFESIEGFDAAGVTAMLTRLMADPVLGRVWLVNVDDEPAGYLLAVFVFSLEHQGLTAEIDELFVLPRHRGLGLGGRLLTAAEGAFRAEGCTNVSLQIGRDNDAARAFYRSHGYEDRAGFELVGKMLGSA